MPVRFRVRCDTVVTGRWRSVQAYRWDKCYQYHDDIRATRDNSPQLTAAFERCNAWFREEECLYECDVNAGKWRKHGDCKDDSGASNAWQMEGMPIKASECDAFYAACSDLVLCTCSGPDCPPDGGPKSLFGLAFLDDVYCKNEKKYCQKTVSQVRVLCCGSVRQRSRVCKCVCSGVECLKVCRAW